MSEAAGAPIGSPPRPAGDKWLTSAAMLAAPLLVPALVIFAAFESISLLDVSFAFVAVTVATFTRAATTKDAAWTTAAFVQMLFSTVLIGLAIATEQKHRLALSELILQSKDLTPGNTTRAAQLVLAAVNQFESASPSALQWILTVALGLIIIILTAGLIAKER